MTVFCTLARSQPIQRAFDSQRAVLQDVSVDHGGADVRMARQIE